MLNYEVIGSGQDLVLLHGFAFNSSIFKKLVDNYKDDYKITTIDLPGYGKSNYIKCDINKWTNQIIKILPNNPILLGWSLGGLLAIKITNIISVKELILVASTPKFIKTKDWKYGIELNQFNQFSKDIITNSNKTLKRFINMQTNNKKQLKQLKQLINKSYFASNTLNCSLNMLLNTDIRQELLAVSHKTTAILGKQDILINYNIKKWYQKHNIKTKIIDAGHLPFLDKNFIIK